MIFHLACKSHNIDDKNSNINCELTVRHCVAPQNTSHHNNNIPQRYRSVTHARTHEAATGWQDPLSL